MNSPTTQTQSKIAHLKHNGYIRKSHALADFTRKRLKLNQIAMFDYVFRIIYGFNGGGIANQITLDRIAKAFNLKDHNHIANMLKSLERAGLISIQRNRNKFGKQTANTYSLTPEVQDLMAAVEDGYVREYHSIFDKCRHELELNEIAVFSYIYRETAGRHHSDNDLSLKTILAAFDMKYRKHMRDILKSLEDKGWIRIQQNKYENHYIANSYHLSNKILESLTDEGVILDAQGVGMECLIGGGMKCLIGVGMKCHITKKRISKENISKSSILPVNIIFNREKNKFSIESHDDLNLESQEKEQQDQEITKAIEEITTNPSEKHRQLTQENRQNGGTEQHKAEPVGKSPEPEPVDVTAENVLFVILDRLESEAIQYKEWCEQQNNVQPHKIRNDYKFNREEERTKIEQHRRLSRFFNEVSFTIDQVADYWERYEHKEMHDYYFDDYVISIRSKYIDLRDKQREIERKREAQERKRELLPKKFNDFLEANDKYFGNIGEDRWNYNSVFIQQMMDKLVEEFGVDKVDSSIAKLKEVYTTRDISDPIKLLRSICGNKIKHIASNTDFRDNVSARTC